MSSNKGAYLRRTRKTVEQAGEAACQAVAARHGGLASAEVIHDRALQRHASCTQTIDAKTMHLNCFLTKLRAQIEKQLGPRPQARVKQPWLGLKVNPGTAATRA